MIAAIDILDEVEVDVAALNGEVVRRAYHGHCCKFFNNQTEFVRLLNSYTTHRLRIHHLRIQEHILSFPSLPVLYARLHCHTEAAIKLRWKLKKLWPCAACIWLYNPTKRFRRFPQLA